MIRPAEKSDASAVLPMLNVIFQDMQLPSLAHISHDDLFKLIKSGYETEDYRYSYRNTMVYELNKKVAGVAVGFPEYSESEIDDALSPYFPIIGLSEETKLFSDKESRPGEWYLDTLCVAKDFRGQGIGTALIKSLIENLQQRDERILSLNVDRGNPKAKKLYTNLGFKATENLMIGTHEYEHMQYAL